MVDLARRLRSHVEALAGVIGERHVWRPESLSETARYIAGVWEGEGFDVRRQELTARGVDCANLEVEIAGPGRPEAGGGDSSGGREGEVLLLGAHYDTIQGSPGANDNGSGVAALLELGRLLRDSRPGCTVRLVAFVNEEAPFFQTFQMGSRVYARSARKRGESLRMMLALETIGYYTDEPGSQRTPPLLGWRYPSRGNFLAFVGTLRMRRPARRAARAFRATSAFPAETVNLPAFVPGVTWSDHFSFWREGYPAAMVTDTAPYRYPHYHESSDTPDKLDYEAMAKVTRGLAGMALRLAK